MSNKAIFCRGFQLIIVLCVAALAPFAGAQTTQSIVGVIKFVGTPPTREHLKIAGDAYCKEVYPDQGPLREEIIVNKNSTLKNVVVSLKKRPESLAAPAASKEPAHLDLTRCLFEPHVLAVEVGQKIVVRNQDGTVHNVNALPRINKRFNQNLPGRGDTATLMFGKAELPVRLKCDVHPWMHAYVAVFDHPWFTITGDDGTFEFPNLVPGEYVIEAWHEKYGAKEAEILVKQDEAAKVEIQYLATNTKSFFGF